MQRVAPYDWSGAELEEHRGLFLLHVACLAHEEEESDDWEDDVQSEADWDRVENDIGFIFQSDKFVCLDALLVEKLIDQECLAVINDASC